MNPRIVYRGTGASIFNEMQMMGFQFGLTRLFNKIFKSDSHDEHPHKVIVKDFLAAGLGGTISAITSSPIELVMIQQQINGGSLIQTPLNIIRNHGIFSNGILRGFIPTACRDSIYVCGMLGITPWLQKHFENEFKFSSSQASFMASLGGGAFAAIPSHPFDVIKTCMQGDIEKKHHTSFLSTFLNLYKHGGFKRLFNGLFWRTINVVATVYIANECKNSLSIYYTKIQL